MEKKRKEEILEEVVKDNGYADLEQCTCLGSLNSSMALLAMEYIEWQTKSDTIEKVEQAISELRSKILHLDDKGNDFSILGAFVELSDKINPL